MNYKIIYDDKQLEFTNKYPALTFSDDSNKNFYRVNDDIIEVKYLKLDDFKQEQEVKRKYKIIFLILKSVNESDLEKLNDIVKYDNVIVGIRDKNFLLNNKIILFKGIDEKINIEALIGMFCNKDILKSIKNKKRVSSMLIGYESLLNPVGNISKSILNNFNHICNYEHYVMYLYSSREFDLQEIAYIEDLLTEYLYEANKIEIKQIKNNFIDDNVFYSILATK
ncbi:MAG: hypothetical protein E7213_05435 [Clostridium sp.]|nr:hypothetical protein [Clostridium sp.]